MSINFSKMTTDSMEIIRTTRETIDNSKLELALMLLDLSCHDDDPEILKERKNIKKLIEGFNIADKKLQEYEF